MISESSHASSFVRALLDHRKLDLPAAFDLLRNFPAEVRSKDVWPEDQVPLLHHVLNMYRLSERPSDKAGLVQFAIQCLESGFCDANESHGQDPPLFFKAVVIKELQLAKSVVSRSHDTITEFLATAVHSDIHGSQGGSSSSSKVWLMRFFTILYGLPSEPVPLAKLLLHADTVIRKNHAASKVTASGAVSININATRRMLAGATVAGQISVKPSDLDALSPSYLSLIEQLGNSDNDDDSSTELSLIDITRILDEAAASVNAAFVAALIGSSGEITHASIGSNNSSISSELGKTEATQLLQWIYIISSVDEVSNRNVLHSLCLSGASIMLDQLSTVLRILLNSARLSAVVTAAATADATLAMKAEHSQMMVLQACKLVSNALTAKDYRGHSPISYAFMRFRDVNTATVDHASGQVERVSSAPILKALHDIAALLTAAAATETSTDADATLFIRVVEMELLNCERTYDPIDLTTIAIASNKDTGATSSTIPKAVSAASIADAYTSVDTVDDGGWPTDESVAAAWNATLDRSRCDILEVWGLRELPNNRDFFFQYVNRGIPVIFRNVGGNTSSSSTSSSGSINKEQDSVVLTSKNLRKHSVLATQRAMKFDTFRDDFGMYQVPSSSIPYAGSFGFQNKVKSIAEVIDSIAAPVIEYRSAIDGSTAAEKDKSSSSSINTSNASNAVPMYTFCTPSAQWSSKLQRKVPVPVSIARSSSSSQPQQQQLNLGDDSGVGLVNQDNKSWNFEIQFYLGPAGSGAPVHFHGHAINTLAYGEKYWTLFSPSQAFYSTTAAAAARSNIQPQQRSERAKATSANALVCTQRSGDVIFVPAMWGHGTLNMRTSIGVAHEFSVESFCME